MNLRSTPFQWGTVAKSFHWIIALAILGNGTFGLLMDLAHSPMQKINWLALHKSIGLTVLALALLRILWRWRDGRPVEEPAPRWQKLAAHAVHAVLYVMIVAMPLSGWWFNSVTGKPLQWFKLFNLPALAAKNEELSHFAHAVHEYLFLSTSAVTGRRSPSAASKFERKTRSGERPVSEGAVGSWYHPKFRIQPKENDMLKTQTRLRFLSCRVLGPAEPSHSAGPIHPRVRTRYLTE